MVRDARRGFTLVELLVVITIIGLLVALLLPAIQSARESSRRSHCVRSLQLLASGCLQHEEQQKFFPSGGWGNAWVGDPSLGFSKDQPGSWLFSILPYVERTDVWQIGRDSVGDEKRAELARQNSIDAPFFHCAARTIVYRTPREFAAYNADPIKLHKARSDYVANAGDFGRHPEALVGSDEWLPFAGPNPSAVAPFMSAKLPERTGISYVRSEVTTDMIADGLSSTLLIGEKYIWSRTYEHFETENQGHRTAYAGFSSENQRVINEYHAPAPDSAAASIWNFGGPHSGAWLAAFCDGSVKSIRFATDVGVVKRLANRHDGQHVERPQ